jgi:LPS-assembly lipoprotein
MTPLRSPRISVFAGLAAAAVLSALLGGCAGFQPLYAAEGVTPKLAAIEVVEPSGRLGFLMHDYLADSFARDRAQRAIYRLNYANREVRVPRGINVSNVATQYEVDLSTTYTLVEIATGKVITRGVVSVNVTYDVQNQPYAALSEAQDGERRAAEQAADRLRLELATFFASPRPVPPASALILPPATNTFSERLAGQIIQTPQDQATGELRPQGGQADTFGGPRSLTVTPDTPQPFNPSTDPNNVPAQDPTNAQTGAQTSAQAKDPSKIDTLPLVTDGTSGQ